MVEEIENEDRYQMDRSCRFDWGPAGADHLAAEDGCLVVVDVLTFTTAVSVATARGMRVAPFPLGRSGAEELARSLGAQLAVARGQESAARPWSLSPVALRSAPTTACLVLPSPNGATIAAAGAGTVVAACLRNARAVAEWLLVSGFGTPRRPVTVIAAGERWRDGTLRPAVEDALGAGAVLSHLRDAGCELSAEAYVAARTYEAVEDLGRVVMGSSSALELASRGYSADVTCAVELDHDATVPVLGDGGFVAAIEP